MKISRLDEMCWLAAGKNHGHRRMKRVGLVIAFFLLVAGLPVLRALRFERDDGRATVTLESLRTLAPDLPPGGRWVEQNDRAVLILPTARDGQLGAFRVPLPDGQPVEAMHVRIDAEAKGLVLGKSDWSDGRMLVEWRSPDGTAAREVDPVCSLEANQSVADLSQVMRPSVRASLPVLRVENLGSAGELRVSRLELTPVREGLEWQVGRWVLLAGWCAWLFVVLSHTTSSVAWRKAAATLLCAGVSLLFVFPGPWKSLRTLGIDYRIGPEVTRSAAVSGSPPVGVPTTRAAITGHTTVAAPLDKVQVADGWILTVKRVLANARPLLHAILLMVPTFCLAMLVGRWAACALGAGIAVGIELAQAAFGFGFDLHDIGDLLSDGAGIALAIGLHIGVTGWLENRRQRRHG